MLAPAAPATEEIGAAAACPDNLPKSNRLELYSKPPGSSSTSPTNPSNPTLSVFFSNSTCRIPELIVYHSRVPFPAPQHGGQTQDGSALCVRRSMSVLEEQSGVLHSKIFNLSSVLDHSLRWHSVTRTLNGIFRAVHHLQPQFHLPYCPGPSQNPSQKEADLAQPPHCSIENPKASPCLEFPDASCHQPILPFQLDAL